MLAHEITRENIEKMVVDFYTEVIKDDLVGPYFLHELGEDMHNHTWQVHLKLMVTYWASVVLGEDSYHRNALGPHTMMEDLSREVFTRWLTLFSQTLDTIYVAKSAAVFKEKAKVIAEEFMLELGIS